jgi:hypothetical protein
VLSGYPDYTRDVETCNVRLLALLERAVVLSGYPDYTRETWRRVTFARLVTNIQVTLRIILLLIYLIWEGMVTLHVKFSKIIVLYYLIMYQIMYQRLVRSFILFIIIYLIWEGIVTPLPLWVRSRA